MIKSKAAVHLMKVKCGGGAHVTNLKPRERRARAAERRNEEQSIGRLIVREKDPL